MLYALLVGVSLCFFGLGAWHPGMQVATETLRPWQMGFQRPVTEIMEEIVKSHNYVMVIMLVIAIIVFLLMAYVMVRFRRRAGEPVKFSTHSHNVLLEVLWTIIPLLIVGFLTVSNIKLIKLQQKIPEADLVVKAIGYQWYWSYEYPEHGIKFDSYMKQDSELEKGELRLLEVDNRVVVPTGKVVLLQSIGGDVIHSWAVPALGIKVDAVPGRLNEVWFSVKSPGVYYGQCSELCGRLHGFMPIVIKAVTPEQFEEWMKGQKASQ